jgi:hypothetical protein
MEPQVRSPGLREWLRTVSIPAPASGPTNEESPLAICPRAASIAKYQARDGHRQHQQGRQR